MFNTASMICVLTILETVWGTGAQLHLKTSRHYLKKNKSGIGHLKKNKSGLVRTKPITVDNLHRESNDVLIRL